MAEFDIVDLTKPVDHLTVHDIVAPLHVALEREFPNREQAAPVLCVVEEAGEFAGAYRRATGQARRAGPWSDVEDELADTVIASYSAAKKLGIDLDAAIHRKGVKILSRGWKDPREGS